MYTSLRDDVRRLCVAGLRFAPVPESCMAFYCARGQIYGCAWVVAGCVSRLSKPCRPSLFTINTSHT